MAKGEYGRRATAAADGGVLHSLGVEFERHRARAGRSWRRYRSTSETAESVLAAELHSDWSQAIEDALETADAISRERPSDLKELLIQYEAIWWWIGQDDNVLDTSTRRWLGRFHGSLRRLATASMVARTDSDGHG